MIKLMKLGLWLGVLGFVCQSADAAALRELLPTSNTVSGWSVIAKTLREVKKPEEFTILYNGGYEEYTDAGAVAGVRQMYQGPNRARISVTIHLMKPEAKAKSFYEKWKKDLAKQSLQTVKVKQQGFLYSTAKLSKGYFYLQDYFVIVEGFGPSEVKSAVEKFMQTISRTMEASLKKAAAKR